MLDSAVSFVSIATGGLTRGKTLHEADYRHIVLAGLGLNLYKILYRSSQTI